MDETKKVISMKEEFRKIEDEVRDRTDELRSWAKENPKMAVAGALGLGILMGHPVSRKVVTKFLIGKATSLI